MDVNGSSMDAGQVLAWFASDAVAAEMPQRDRGYFEDRGELNHVAQTLLEMVEKVQTAIEVEDSIGLLHELVNVAQYASGTAAYRMARARRSRPASTSGEG